MSRMWSIDRYNETCQREYGRSADTIISVSWGTS